MPVLLVKILRAKLLPSKCPSLNNKLLSVVNPGLEHNFSHLNINIKGVVDTTHPPSFWVTRNLWSKMFSHIRMENWDKVSKLR